MRRADLETPGKFVHMGKVTRRNDGQMSKLALWGLIEEDTRRKEDGGRPGQWRITREGHLFLEGRLKLPKYAHVYNHRLLGFSGPMISVRDAYKQFFNLRELMAGAGGVALALWLLFSLRADSVGGPARQRVNPAS